MACCQAIKGALTNRISFAHASRKREIDENFWLTLFAVEEHSFGFIKMSAAKVRDWLSRRDPFLSDLPITPLFIEDKIFLLASTTTSRPVLISTEVPAQDPIVGEEALRHFLGLTGLYLPSIYLPGARLPTMASELAGRLKEAGLPLSSVERRSLARAVVMGHVRETELNQTYSEMDASAKQSAPSDVRPAKTTQKPRPSTHPPQNSQALVKQEQSLSSVLVSTSTSSLNRDFTQAAENAYFRNFLKRHPVSSLSRLLTEKVTKAMFVLDDQGHIQRQYLALKGGGMGLDLEGEEWPRMESDLKLSQIPFPYDAEQFNLEKWIAQLTETDPKSSHAALVQLLSEKGIAYLFLYLDALANTVTTQKVGGSIFNHYDQIQHLRKLMMAAAGSQKMRDMIEDTFSYHEQLLMAVEGRDPFGQAVTEEILGMMLAVLGQWGAPLPLYAVLESMVAEKTVNRDEQKPVILGALQGLLFSQNGTSILPLVRFGQAATALNEHDTEIQAAIKNVFLSRYGQDGGSAGFFFVYDEIRIAQGISASLYSFWDSVVRQAPVEVLAPSFFGVPILYDPNLPLPKPWGDWPSSLFSEIRRYFNEQKPTLEDIAKSLDHMFQLFEPKKEGVKARSRVVMLLDQFISGLVEDLEVNNQESQSESLFDARDKILTHANNLSPEFMLQEEAQRLFQQIIYLVSYSRDAALLRALVRITEKYFDWFNPLQQLVLKNLWEDVVMTEEYLGQVEDTGNDTRQSTRDHLARHVISFLYEREGLANVAMSPAEVPDRLADYAPGFWEIFINTIPNGQNFQRYEWKRFIPYFHGLSDNDKDWLLRQFRFLSLLSSQEITAREKVLAALFSPEKINLIALAVLDQNLANDLLSFWAAEPTSSATVYEVISRQVNTLQQKASLDDADVLLRIENLATVRDKMKECLTAFHNISQVIPKKGVSVTAFARQTRKKMDRIMGAPDADEKRSQVVSDGGKKDKISQQLLNSADFNSGVIAMHEDTPKSLRLLEQNGFGALAARTWVDAMLDEPLEVQIDSLKLLLSYFHYFSQLSPQGSVFNLLHYRLDRLNAARMLLRKKSQANLLTALGDLGIGAPEVLNYIIENISSPDSKISVEVMKAVAKFCPESSRAARNWSRNHPAIQESLKIAKNRENWEVRFEVRILAEKLSLSDQLWQPHEVQNFTGAFFDELKEGVYQAIGFNSSSLNIHKDVQDGLMDIGVTQRYDSPVFQRLYGLRDEYKFAQHLLNWLLSGSHNEQIQVMTNKAYEKRKGHSHGLQQLTPFFYMDFCIDEERIFYSNTRTISQWGEYGYARAQQENLWVKRDFDASLAAEYETNEAVAAGKFSSNAEGRTMQQKKIVSGQMFFVAA